MNNAFKTMCTCGLTDWCSGNKADCGETNPQLLADLEARMNQPRKVVPLEQLAAPLLAKFGK